jgi:hypothetical protein
MMRRMMIVARARAACRAATRFRAARPRAAALIVVAAAALRVYVRIASRDWCMRTQPRTGIRQRAASQREATRDARTRVTNTHTDTGTIHTRHM